MSTILSTLAQEKIEQMHIELSENHAIEDYQKIVEGYNVSEPMAIEINDAIIDESKLLKDITVLPVTDPVGDVIQTELDELIASRTDTKSGVLRKPALVGGASQMRYKCEQIDFDVAMPYSLINTYARFPNFGEKYHRAVKKRMALDKEFIGFNGTHVAKTSDKTKYPLGEDLNIGWPTLVKIHNPKMYLSQSGDIKDKITIGKYGDFKNITAMAFYLFGFIDPKYRTGKEVCIVGSELLKDDLTKEINRFSNVPNQKAQIDYKQGTLAGLKVKTYPGFPPFGMMVCDPKNLQYLYQIKSLRQSSENNPKANRYEEYNTSNDACALAHKNCAGVINDKNVVLNPEKIVLIQNPLGIATKIKDQISKEAKENIENLEDALKKAYKSLTLIENPKTDEPKADEPKSTQKVEGQKDRPKKDEVEKDSSSDIGDLKPLDPNLLKED